MEWAGGGRDQERSAHFAVGEGYSSEDRWAIGGSAGGWRGGRGEGGREHGGGGGEYARLDKRLLEVEERAEASEERERRERERRRAAEERARRAAKRCVGLMRAQSGHATDYFGDWGGH